MAGNDIRKEEIIIDKIISWKFFYKKMYEVFGKKFKYVDELYFNVEKELNFQEENELEDIEALGYLKELHEFKGELYVVTDISYRNELGPFLVEAGSVNEFVRNFYSNYGEAFYCTDILIVSFSEKLIWVLFHEGICWLTKGI